MLHLKTLATAIDDVQTVVVVEIDSQHGAEFETFVLSHKFDAVQSAVVVADAVEWGQCGRSHTLTQGEEVGFESCCLFDGCRDIAAVGSPLVVAPVLVLANLTPFEPVVVDGEIVTALVGVEVELRVAHIPHHGIEQRVAHRFDAVLLDRRIALGGQCVDGTAVAHLAAEVVDVVADDVIVVHTTGFLCPSPTHADSRVGRMADFVMGDADVRRKTYADAHAAPVVRADVGDVVVIDDHSVADHTFIVRIVGLVGFKRLVAEIAGQDGCASDIVEHAALNACLFRSAHEVEGRRTDMFETAIRERYIAGILHAHGSRRTAYPCYVSAWSRIVRIGVVKPLTSLQSHMSSLRRTHPGGMFERDAAELQVCHFRLYRTLNADERFERRNNSLDRRGIFAFARPVVERMALCVVIPFLRAVQQFDGIAEVEMMVGETRLVGTQNGPRTLKFDAAFRIHECQARTLAIVHESLHAQVVHGPVLNDGQFYAFGMAERLTDEGDGEFALRLVNRNQPRQRQVVERAGTAHFRVADPHLANARFRHTEVVHRRTPHLSLCRCRKSCCRHTVLPSADCHSTAQHRPFFFGGFDDGGRSRCTRILGCQRECRGQAVSTSAQDNVHLAQRSLLRRLSHLSDVQKSLLQCGQRSLLCSFGLIVAVGRNPQNNGPAFSLPHRFHCIRADPFCCLSLQHSSRQKEHRRSQCPAFQLLFCVHNI